MAGGSLCYATGSMYGVLNLETGRSVELFPYDANSVYPLMVAIQNTEYLIVNGTTESAIGIFITGKGEPTRGTIPFPSYPLGIGKYFFVMLKLTRCFSIQTPVSTFTPY